MDLNQVLEKIFREKGVVSVEFFGVELIYINVINGTGALKIIDIFLQQCTVDDILTAIRRHTHG